MELLPSIHQIVLLKDAKAPNKRFLLFLCLMSESDGIIRTEDEKIQTQSVAVQNKLKKVGELRKEYVRRSPFATSLILYHPRMCRGS